MFVNTRGSLYFQDGFLVVGHQDTNYFRAIQLLDLVRNEGDSTLLKLFYNPDLSIS